MTLSFPVMLVNFVEFVFLTSWVCCVLLCSYSNRLSKGILSDISLICQLNCYQTISSPICLQRCVVTCVKMLKLNSCGKCWKKFVKVEVSLSEVLLAGCKWCSLALRKGEGWRDTESTRAAIRCSACSNLNVTEVEF